MNNKLERKYGLFTAICMVVGIVIGSGVFFKAQTILQITNGDMPLGVIAWLIGGAIMLACILTFAGMSQKYEKVNGHRGLCRSDGRPEIRLLYGLVPVHDLLSVPDGGSGLGSPPAIHSCSSRRCSRICRCSSTSMRAASWSARSASRSCCSTSAAPMPSTRFLRSSQARSRHPPRSSSSSRSASWRSSASLPVSPRVS